MTTLIPKFEQTSSTVNRAINLKLQESVSVKDFGAVGDGSTDDTTAIQAAITANPNGTVYLPAGTYKISSVLNITASTTLVGAGINATFISQSTNSTGILNFTGTFGGFNNLAVSYSGTPVSGATAVNSTAGSLHASDFAINSAYIGLNINTNASQYFTRFYINNYVEIGIGLDNVNDIYFSQFILNAGSSSNGALGGIRMTNFCQAIIFTDGDVILGQYPITSDSSSGNIGTSPSFNNFTNVFFDSAVHGASLNKMFFTEFVGCWFSNGRSGGGDSGCNITNSSDLSFTNSRFFNNGSNGCLVASSNSNIAFDTCSFSYNGLVNSTTANGLSFANNTQKFLVTNCTSNSGGGTQQYGMYIGSGCTNFIVIGNNNIGNALSGLSNGGTGTYYVSSNLG